MELSLERVGESFDIDRFVYAISVNRTVRHICFSGTFVRELSPEQWRMALSAVGHLETLEELQIWCSTIPVQTLAELIRMAAHLKKIYFFRVKLAGSQDDYVQLAESMRSHIFLQDIRIGGFETCSVENDPLDIDMDVVVKALSQAQALRVVSLQLSGSRDRAPFSDAALELLFLSPTIKELYLSRLGLSSTHFTVISQQLKQNHHLRILDLFGNIFTNLEIQQIMAGVEHNEGLETLVLPCSDEDLTPASSLAISQALKVNTTLINLNLPRGSFSDDGLLHLSEGLSINKTLKKIEVDVSKDVGDRGRAALLSMLEKNYGLERLVIGSAESSIKEKVDYYMRLNEAGRGSLLKEGHSNRHEWVEMLISVSDDLDCLFYFTTMNPTLCQYANAGTTDVIITEEFKKMRRHTLHMCGLLPTLEYVLYDLHRPPDTLFALLTH